MVGTELLQALQGELGGRPRRVLVTGASGFLGSHLARALAEAGQDVVAVGRNPLATTRVRHARIDFRTLDIRDARALQAASVGAAAVFHAAALCTPWAPLAELRAINVEGTRNVVESCLSNGVARLIHVSSTAILFDARDRLDIPGDAPPPRRSICGYAASKREAEAVVHSGVERGLDAVLVRARAIFGPGDGALLPRVLESARKGRLRRIGHGRNVIDLTYVDNLVFGLVLAWLRGARGDTLTITNASPVELWPTLEWLVAGLGYPTPLRAIPYGVARTVAHALELAHRLLPRLGEPALTRYTAALLARSQTFDPRGALEKLGYRPLVSVATGLRRTLDALQRPAPVPATTAVDWRLFSTGWTTRSLHLAQRGAAHVATRFHATFALLRHPHEGALLFDTGYSTRFAAATRRLPNRLYRWATEVETSEPLGARELLRRAGVDAHDVRYIVISHFHADHIGGLRDFPRARFVVARSAWEALRHRRGLAAVRKGFLPELLPEDFCERLAPISDFADPGIGPFARAHDLFGDGAVRLLPLPGHARGQLGALVRSADGARRLLLADAAYTTASIRDCAPPHALTRIFTDSAVESQDTLRRLQQLSVAEPEVELVPSHCPEVARRYRLDEQVDLGPHSLNVASPANAG